MSKLGDFLGDLLTEVTMARVQADLESVRIAELYANHPLLKHMPVPRFRLPTVHFDVPVLIRGQDGGDGGEPPRLDPEEATGKFIEILERVLEDHDQELLSDERERVRRAAVLTIAEHLELPRDVAGSVTGPANDLIKIAVRTVRPRLQAGRARNAPPDADPLLSAIRESLRRRVMTAFLRFIAAPRRLEADMTTSHVKEAGDREMLARVKMEVSEDGVEWATVVDRDGELAERLVSE